MDNLEQLSTTIEKLLQLSGSPGLSLGVTQHGRTYTANFGQRLVSEQTPPDENTLYYIGSLTKLVTACVIAGLVSQKKLEWDVPVRKYLPEFERDDDIGRCATIVDLLSNRTGLTVQPLFFGQQVDEYLTPKENVIEASNTIDADKPFRKGFLYSIWNWTLLTILIERVSGKSFTQCVEDIVFRPLNMQRSSSDRHDVNSIDNMVQKTVVMENSKPFVVENPRYITSGFISGAGCCSSVKELLMMYQALMSAYRHQRGNNVDETPGSPFTHLRRVLSPHIAINNKSHLDTFGYCLGVYRSVLPANLGTGTINQALIPRKEKQLVVGSQHAGVEVFHHSGVSPGFFANKVIIPELDLAVIVLTNSMPWFDVTDFVSQLVTSRLLDNEDRSQTLLAQAAMARKSMLALYPMQTKMLDKHRSSGPPPLPLSAYEGVYTHKGGNFHCIMEKHEDTGCLHMTFHHFKKYPKTLFVLHPYAGHTFYWPPDRDSEYKQGMWPFTGPNFRLFQFKANKSGGIDSFYWHHDFSNTKGDVFRKTTQSAQSRL